MTNLVEKILTGAEPRTGNPHPFFHACPVPALLYRCDGVVTAANPAALALFRCGTAELHGVSLVSLVPELDQAFKVASLTSHRRVAVRRPDGHNFIARVQLAPLQPDSNDGPLMATLEDLSEYEQEVAAAHKELESFMSAAGHDLRGPLRILKGFTDALEDECGESLTGDARAFLKEILKAADRMEGLIDGLLALSRAGRVEMTLEALDLTTLVDLVSYELRHEKNARNVEVSVEPGMTAWGDVRLMMVLLRNLIGNAWKFTGRVDHPWIHVHSQLREGRRYFCVSDNGAGFDMAHAERLFQPFTRLHRQDEFPGQGLGLATVRRIVRRHGGDVHAESAPGQGATFSFWLNDAPRD